MKRKYLAILFGTLFVLGLMSFGNTLLSPLSEPEIVFDNITSEQENYSLQLLEKLDPDYLHYVDKIIFTNDLSKYCHWSACAIYCGKDNQCRGLNDQKGNIYVNWYHGSRSVKENLCHELLHFFYKAPESNSRDDPVHRVLIDGARKGVCYK